MECIVAHWNHNCNIECIVSGSFEDHSILYLNCILSAAHPILFLSSYHCKDLLFLGDYGDVHQCWRKPFVKCREAIQRLHFVKSLLHNHSPCFTLPTSAKEIVQILQHFTGSCTFLWDSIPCNLIEEVLNSSLGKERKALIKIGRI